MRERPVGAGARPTPLPLAPDPRTALVPPGFGLVADEQTELLDGGAVVLGGSPMRLLRVKPAGARLIARWAAGTPVGRSPNERVLARRLLDAGAVHPRPVRGGPGPDDVTVVVPVRDRPEDLARLLSSLPTTTAGVLVVDDGSLRPTETERVATAAGAGYLALTENRGPAAARNAGLAAVGTALVAFVDSDCVTSPDWLEPLLGHFADPLVAGVAPRVVAAGGDSWLDRYEVARSPLDRGPRPALVRPRGRVTYVPSAALVLRRSVVAGGCFDESLRGGEDVDLCWRLHRAGWRLRYEPAATVTHARRPSLAGWLGQRAFYGTTAGPLSRRHPGALAPVAVSAWTAATWALLLAGRPVAAGAVSGIATRMLSRRLQGVVGDPGGCRGASSGGERPARPSPPSKGWCGRTARRSPPPSSSAAGDCRPPWPWSCRPSMTGDAPGPASTRPATCSPTSPTTWPTGPGCGWAVCAPARSDPSYPSWCWPPRSGRAPRWGGAPSPAEAGRLRVITRSPFDRYPGWRTSGSPWAMRTSIRRAVIRQPSARRAQVSS